LFIKILLISVSFAFTYKKFRDFINSIIFHSYIKNKIKNFEKGKKFINLCLEGSLIQKEIFSKLKKPLISIIIPVYNCQKSINASIISIQNQNFSEIEILLINDASNDNTPNIINNFQKEDSRIKIINNNKNMGTLYSRCIGALLSRGEYITTLDNDDMFFSGDIFSSIYKIGKDDNLDIIEFNSVFIENYSYDIFQMEENFKYSFNYTLNQPRLGMNTFLNNGKYNDINIWGKFIKKEIYKNSVNLLGKRRYTYFICWAEDTMIVFIIFNIANTFKFINKYGVIHLVSNSTASFTQSEYNILFAEIILLDVIFEFSKNTYNKNFIVKFALMIQKKHKINEFKNHKIVYILKIIVRKLIKCKYISKLSKKKLQLFLNFS
jgi:glycosyltransferase involved in cell wall biosynthesis